MALSATSLKQAYDAVVERGWSSLTLTDIAEATGMTLADLRGQLSSKYDLIADLNRHVDAEVLADVGSVDLNDPPRDRLFEVMMARFDALAPFKDALGAMAMAARSDLQLAALTRRSIERSMGWMLEAAGLSSGGWKGMFRRNGLALVYVRTSLVWLKDDSEDLAATMKSMDRALGDAERWANSVENASFGEGFSRAREQFRDMADRARAAAPGGFRFRGNDDDPAPETPDTGDIIDATPDQPQP